MEAAASTELPKPRRQRLMRIILAFALIGGVIFFGRQLGGYVPRFAAWVETLGAWGPAAFMVGYILATVAFVPGSLLTLAAGAIFGLVPGTIYVFIAATLGASAAFLISRYLARRAIEKRLEGNERFAAVDRAIARQARKIVFLLRLSPVFPFNLLNYALGLTQVRFPDYLLASVGMLPGTVLYVYSGKLVGDVAALAGEAQAEKGAGYYVVLALGLIATLVVTTIVTRSARRALQEATHGSSASN